MIVGQEGTGKTSFVENLVQSRLPVTKVQMSPTLTSLQLQELILERVSQLDKRSGHRLVGGVRGGASKLASSMRSTFFLDDIQLALSMSDSGGRIGERVCSPVLELARYAIQQHQLVDFSRSYSHSLNNVHYITSCTPGEYWKLSHQLSHSFNPVPFLPPSDECLHKVFSRSVLYWLEQFPDSATGGDPEPLAKVRSFILLPTLDTVSGAVGPLSTQTTLTCTTCIEYYIYSLQGILPYLPGMGLYNLITFFCLLGSLCSFGSCVSQCIQEIPPITVNSIPSLHYARPAACL